MVRIKTYALRNPLLFSVLIMIAVVIFEIIPAKYFYLLFMDERIASYLGDITMRGIICILILIMLKYFGIFKTAGFTTLKNWRQPWLIWPVVLLILVNSLDILTGKVIIDTSTAGLLPAYITDALSIGFFEEILVRGGILSLMLSKWGSTRRGVYLSVISSSTIFGLAHIINFIQDPNLVFATFAQIFYATFFGLVFASLLLRTHTIWLMIILHALFNFSGSIREIAIGGGAAASELTKASITLSNALVAIIFTLPLLIYGLFILRKVKTNYVPAPIETSLFPEKTGYVSRM